MQIYDEGIIKGRARAGRLNWLLKRQASPFLKDCPWLKPAKVHKNSKFQADIYLFAHLAMYTKHTLLLTMVYLQFQTKSLPTDICLKIFAKLF